MVKNIIQTKFIAPKERPYQTENLYAVLERQRKLEKEVSAIAKGKKQTQREHPAGANSPESSPAPRKADSRGYPAGKGRRKAHTAQQTIPLPYHVPGRICRVSEKKYSKSVAFEDINYQLAQPDDKTAIFENWCDFLNYFDASVSVQLSSSIRGHSAAKRRKLSISRHRTTLLTLSVPSTGIC